MPLMKLQVSVPITDDKKDKVLPGMVAAVTKATGKPEAYMMVSVETADVRMAGKKEPAAYADVRGIGGFNAKVNAQITKDTCDLLNRELGIKPDNVYVTFTDVAAQNWGWNGSTFG